MIQIKVFYLIYAILILCDLIDYIKALQCRIEESSSDYEMKKVIRKCLRKFEFNNQNFFNNFNNNNQNNRDLNDEFSDSMSNEEDNSNRLKNREHLQMRISNRFKRLSNNEQKRQQDEQNDRQNFNGNGNNRNERYNINGYHTKNGYNNGSDSAMMDQQYQNDTNCIVNCFFKEMNMLNHEDYPDKYKVLHILTKDVREHDLREFYTDSIQECYHFLDMEKRKNKCLYSKRLINCMTDYAKANCDDWKDQTINLN